MNKSFKVIKTTNNGLNLHLLAKTSKRKLHYSHFMDVDVGVKLITALRNAINYLERNKLGICSHCGEAFFYGDDVFLISSEDHIHKICLTEYLENVKNKDIVLPLKRFKTGECVKSPCLTDESLKNELFSVSVCDYGIERIWLHISESHDKNKKLYTFGYYEAVELANNMEAVVAKIHSECLGHCYHCEKPYYINEKLYKLSNGEIIHRSCTPKFVQSVKSSGVKMPLIPINLVTRGYLNKYTAVCIICESWEEKE